VRSASRTFLQFNGSGGLWRKACMDSAGGWNDETLVEDMDLSLRAYLIGWHALWLHDVRTPNELPSSYAAYRKQQYRWVYGPMQLYKRCVRFIWESHLPLLHKLYVVIFFFSVRSTSLIANAAFFTLLLPMVGVLHYSMPDLGVIVPWWSALLLPAATTLSVMVHTPRSLKYTVLYVLYENVLALHKAQASLEGMLGMLSGFKWPVTLKAGHASRHGFACDADCKRLRERVFLRELAVGFYLLFSGVWLSYKLQRDTLFWYYGIYAWVQGLTYILFGLSVVDNVNFEPELPESMKRAYRRQLSRATPRLSDILGSYMDATAASPRVQAVQRAQRKSLAEMRKASNFMACKAKSLKRMTSSRTLPRQSEAPGLPWAMAKLRVVEAARAESFVHVGACNRVASGRFVAGTGVSKRRTDASSLATNKTAASLSSAAAFSSVTSPPPSPPPSYAAASTQEPGTRCSPAGDAALQRALAAHPLPVRRHDPLMSEPKIPMPTRRHLQKIGAERTESFHLLKKAPTNCSEAEPVMMEQSLVPENEPRKTLSNIIPGESDVAIVHMHQRFCVHTAQALLSAPLWLLNAIAAYGIYLVMVQLSASRIELLENLVAFIYFAILLPLLLIFTNGQAVQNTRAAWASLEGRVDARMQLVQTLQLVAMAIAVAIGAFLAAYTSSSRFKRWVRCELEWTTAEYVLLVRLNTTTVSYGWQCGDGFFS